MKTLLFTTLFFACTLCVSAQAQNPEFGSCFSQSNRNSIAGKMTHFLQRVSNETGCPKEKLTYTVDHYYTVFYSKQCRHLPKQITVDACGVKRTYRHNGLSGGVLFWLWGSWSRCEN